MNRDFELLFDPEKHIFRSNKFKSVVYEAIEFMDKIPLCSLPPPVQFIGVGVYSIFYNGNFEHYRPFVQSQAKPFIYIIYVGKAVPPGWRTARAHIAESSSLFNRLLEHAHSIEQTNNLDLQDFKSKFMILNDPESDLIVPIEAELIRKYQPLWNKYIDGFGNHDPGAGRYNQAKSEWDVLHPGRYWAKRLKGKSPSLEVILKKIKQFSGFIQK